MPDSSSGVWKWVAALLATAMLAGLPGYLSLYLNSPTREEVDLVRERQEAVLQRLSAIDIRLLNHEDEDEELRDLYETLRSIILQIQQRNDRLAADTSGR